jgi:membrane-associated phospholipid phosphatase
MHKQRWIIRFLAASLLLLVLRITSPHDYGVWDAGILGWFFGLRTPPLDQAMLTITWLGSLFVLAPVACLVCIRLASQGRQEEAWFLVYSLAGAALLGRLAKWWIERPRPDLHTWLSQLPLDTSYPSLHALQATAFLLGLALILNSKGFWPVAFILAAAIAISRLYLQVHFPSDIVAGALTAILWTLCLHWTREKAHAK